MQEYKFLRIARVIFKVLSWVVLGLGIVVGIIVLVTGGNVPTGAVTPQGTPIPQTPRAAGVVFMIMGALYFVAFYTLSEIIGILLDIRTTCKPSA
jgi:predicted secreted protein